MLKEYVCDAIKASTNSARRRLPGLFVLCALLAIASQAVAGDEDYYPRYGAQLRATPFRPRFSTRADVDRVRESVYGPAPSYFKNPILGMLDVDFYLSDRVGLLGIYGRAGYWATSAKGKVCKDATGKAAQCTAQSIINADEGNDDTKLTTIPVGLGVVYRFDILRRDYDIPVVFSAKAGLDYYIWFSTLGDQSSKLAGTNQDAKGGTLGGSASVQAALALDVFSKRSQPYGSRSARQVPYLFVEYGITHAAGLFQPQPRLDFSNFHMFSAGLAVDIL